jgi:hypothetical protein
LNSKVNVLPPFYPFCGDELTSLATVVEVASGLAIAVDKEGCDEDDDESEGFCEHVLSFAKLLLMCS